jgi:hypothetical protein
VQRAQGESVGRLYAFSFALPGIVSVALNTGHPERVKENIATARNHVPAKIWRALKDAGLLEKDYPLG